MLLVFPALQWATKLALSAERRVARLPCGSMQRWPRPYLMRFCAISPGDYRESWWSRPSWMEPGELFLRLEDSPNLTIAKIAGIAKNCQVAGRFSNSGN